MNQTMHVYQIVGLRVDNPLYPFGQPISPAYSSFTQAQTAADTIRALAHEPVRVVKITYMHFTG